MLDELVRHYDATYEILVDGLDFTLENGAAQLKPFFPNIERRRYEDALLVTEVDPLVAYVESSFQLHTDKIDESLNAFSDYVREVMSETGSILIPKDSGLFIAW